MPAVLYLAPGVPLSATKNVSTRMLVVNSMPLTVLEIFITARMLVVNGMPLTVLEILSPRSRLR